MKETASSNPVIAKKISTNGKPSNIPIILADINEISIPLQVNIKVWPAVILAINRVPRDIDRLAYETSSMINNKGFNTVGVPSGTKKDKKCDRWIETPKTVTAIKTKTDSPKLTTALAVRA